MKQIEPIGTRKYSKKNSISIPFHLKVENTSYPLLLLIITLLSFGVLLPFLGFSGDDFSQIWLAYRVGSIQTFFQYNRPIYGQLFFILSKILSPSPWQWHLALLLLRWLIALMVFNIFHRIKNIDERIPYFVSLLFLIYPGALIYYMPVTFIGTFLILFLLLFSFWLSLASLKKSKWFIAHKIISIAIAVFNLVTLEYFFFLELLRPFLIWLALEERSPHKRIKKTLIESIPYLLVFAAVSIYRATHQSEIVVFESPVLLTEFIASPIRALNQFIPAAMQDMLKFGIWAWTNTFRPWDYIAAQGETTAALYVFLVLIAGTIIYFNFKKTQKTSSGRESLPSKTWQIIVLGVLALFLAGFAPWIAGLSPSIEPVIENRFSIAFALGAALVFSGFLALLPKKSHLPIIILSVISALSIGIHFYNANDFRYQWVEQKRFYWELAWRFPTLPAPTTIVADYYTEKYQAENPLSAAINWMYYHEIDEQPENQIGYYIVYDESRLDPLLNNLEEPLPPMYGHLIGICSYPEYHLLTILNQHECMQVLNPHLAELDPTLTTPYLIKAVKLSDLNGQYVEDKDHQAVLDPALFGAEPEHEWCYYFEKADLARSQGNWEEAIALFEEAKTRGYLPSSPSEKLVFLEAYLGKGDWDGGLNLSREILKDDPKFYQAICRLWEDSPNTSQKRTEMVEKILSCSIP